MGYQLGDDAVACGADLAGYEGYGGRLVAGAVQLAGAGTAEFLIVTPGAKTSAGVTTGMTATIRYLGRGVGIAGGAINRGNRLQTGAAGTWVVATTGQNAIAKALEDASSGQQFNMLVQNVNRVYPEA